MHSEQFAYVWEFMIDPNCVAEFLAAYREDGEWVRLFSNDADFIKTELLHDSSNTGRYLTVDYWTSEAARNAFREKYAAKFAALDEKCEGYTLREQFIGDFVIVSACAKRQIT